MIENIIHRCNSNCISEICQNVAFSRFCAKKKHDRRIAVRPGLTETRLQFPVSIGPIVVFQEIKGKVWWNEKVLQSKTI